MNRDVKKILWIGLESPPPPVSTLFFPLRSTVPSTCSRRSNRLRPKGFNPFSSASTALLVFLEKRISYKISAIDGLSAVGR